MAEALLYDGTLESVRDERYAGWKGDLGQQILEGRASLAAVADAAVQSDLDPAPVSGRQEWLENKVNHVIWGTT